MCIDYNHAIDGGEMIVTLFNPLFDYFVKNDMDIQTPSSWRVMRGASALVVMVLTYLHVLVIAVS